MPLTSYISAYKKASHLSIFERSRTKLSRVYSAVGLSLISCIGLAHPSLAQLSEGTSAVNPVVFNAPPLPPGQGAPTGRRDGGASRGDCPDYQALTALVPVTEGRVWGQTTAAHPSLWFHLDAAVTPEMTIELYMQDTDDNLLYETTIATEMEPGIFAIALPPTTVLPENEPHLWTLSLFCDSEEFAASMFVNGTISRVSANEISDGLESLTAETVRSLAQAQRYADAGMWHDALTILGELQQADSTDIQAQQAWKTLLEQVGLEQSVDASVLPCCKAE